MPAGATARITHSTREVLPLEAEVMIGGAVADSLMRNFPQTGTMHNENHEMLPGNSNLPGSLFDQLLAVTTHRQNTFVVYDDELPIVVGILLDFWRMLGPIQSLSH